MSASLPSSDQKPLTLRFHQCQRLPRRQRNPFQQRQPRPGPRLSAQARPDPASHPACPPRLQWKFRPLLCQSSFPFPATLRSAASAGLPGACPRLRTRSMPAAHRAIPAAHLLHGPTAKRPPCPGASASRFRTLKPRSGMATPTSTGSRPAAVCAGISNSASSAGADGTSACSRASPFAAETGSTTGDAEVDMPARDPEGWPAIGHRGLEWLKKCDSSVLPANRVSHLCLPASLLH